MDLQKVNTKLEAYRLVHDPTRLLSLLFSKYGDIEEDYFLLISNQFVLNKPSHLNAFFKERKIIEDKDEYLRRLYNKKEATKRIPKLNEYYKNYHLFFCKATLTDFHMGSVLKNYEDNKAEIFYKNNYEDSLINKEEKSEKNESSSLSSLDNVTYNKIIFDKKNKEIIEKNLDSKNISLTLTLDSLRPNKSKKNWESSKNLIDFDENSEKEDSFIKSIKNIVYYQENKKKNKNVNNVGNNEVIKQNYQKSNIYIKEITRKNPPNATNINKKDKDKVNNLSNLCKKLNENIKKKKNNKNENNNNNKEINNSSYKDNNNNNSNQDNNNSNKDNNNISCNNKDTNNNKDNNNNTIQKNKENREGNYYKLLHKLNIHNSLYSLSKKNIINNENNNNNKNTVSKNENKNNVFLSPQARKHYFTNITSRISEFNKNKPTNMKNTKRNKSYRINNSTHKKNHLIYQNPIITNNNSKNYSHYPYTNQFLDYNINNLKNISITNKNKNQYSNYLHNTKKDTNISNNTKPNPSQIVKYNQFLMINNKTTLKNKKNNKTYNLNSIGNSKNLKILPKAKNFMYNLKKMTKTKNNSPMNIEYKCLGSKLNLFKSGVSPPSSYNNVKKQKNNRHFNNFHIYNKLAMNQTNNFNDYKKYMMSNSIENNIHLKSLSPKAISSNITITNEKKRSIGFNKINFNKFTNNNNFKNQNTNNKIKIPVRHNKNNISYSNSNYNINFNNLIFYSSNTPKNIIDDIKYSIVNNNNINNNSNSNYNNNSNQNSNKINTNFYMMNFNNLYNNNSRNKVKFNGSNYSSQNKVRTTNTTSQSKLFKKIEGEKYSTNGGASGGNLNENKIPFTVSKQVVAGKIKKSYGHSKHKEKSHNIFNKNSTNKNNNSVKKANNKSYNLNDSEKNNENHADKIEKKKYSLINLKELPEK